MAYLEVTKVVTFF